ncbi:MAG: 50S ribosomal protein L11 methyltransferase [Flavobacteriales bacterium]|nr:50S ribosomal protein L11 methyltransferase [Flavobacteriales bacterium]MBL6872743.1 50S ribosomal protein L11 methyltransferase [Flavobacteriales bacterium]
MNYNQVIFSFELLEPWSEILIAYLSELNFESFEETSEGIIGYILENEFSKDDIQEICEKLDCAISFDYKTVGQENWNSKWESSFNPIVIDDFCGIRADFHSQIEVENEIIITPKMSFGTGHHSTTKGMIKAMRHINFESKNVLDMGCGTAVLAILAEKLNAHSVQAIDIEEWAYKNAIENTQKNECNNITVLFGGSEKIKGDFDIILANINRNILLSDMSIYASHLKADGLILFSGFYEKDLDIIKDEATIHKLDYIEHFTIKDWVITTFRKRT